MHTKNKRRRKSQSDRVWDTSTIKIPYLTSQIERKSGIYALYNIDTDKFYIGSTFDFVDRRQWHFNSLLRGDHANTYLQRSFNLHGIDKIAMIIIELCEEQNLIQREQYYLDLYQTYKREIGYNISEIAGRNIPEGIKYKLFSPDGKLVEGQNLRRFCRENSLSIQAFNKYYGRKKKQGYGIIAGGWRVFNENLHPNRDLTPNEVEELKKMDYEKRYAYQRKIFRFLVNGVEIEIKNLKEYADKNGLDKNILADTYRRNTIPYKGHISLLNEKIMQRQMTYKGRKVHFLISDDKELLKIFNLRAFCKEKAINRVFLKKMSRKDLMYKGYFILALNISEMELNQDYIDQIYSEKLKVLFNCN